MDWQSPQMQFIKKIAVICSVAMTLALLVGFLAKGGSLSSGKKPVQKSKLPYVIENSR